MANKDLLYSGLMEVLKAEIMSERKAHSQLPSERELSVLYHVSRTTVRAALKQLELEGYIYKEQGKGTFVAEASNRMTNLSKMYSFTDQMKQVGKIPQTQVLSFGISHPSEALQTAMHLTAEDRVYEISRLRLADHVPLMVETTYLPEKFFPNLKREDIASKALYAIFNEDYQQEVKEAREEFFAAVANRSQSSALHVELASPVFRLNRISYNSKHQIIEWTESIARGDKFRYQVIHQRQ